MFHINTYTQDAICMDLGYFFLHHFNNTKSPLILLLCSLYLHIILTVYLDKVICFNERRTTTTVHLQHIHSYFLTNHFTEKTWQTIYNIKLHTFLVFNKSSIQARARPLDRFGNISLYWLTMPLFPFRLFILRHSFCFIMRAHCWHNILFLMHISHVSKRFILISYQFLGWYEVPLWLVYRRLVDDGTHSFKVTRWQLGRVRSYS